MSYLSTLCLRRMFDCRKLPVQCGLCEWKKIILTSVKCLSGSFDTIDAFVAKIFMIHDFHDLLAEKNVKILNQS